MSYKLVVCAVSVDCESDLTASPVPFRGSVSVRYRVLTLSDPVGANRLNMF